MKMTQDEWKKIGKEAGWDKIYTDNGYDPPIEKTAAYDEMPDFTEDEIHDDKGLGQKSGEIDFIDLNDILDVKEEPMSPQDHQRLFEIMGKLEDVDYQISIDYFVDVEEVKVHPEAPARKEVQSVVLEPNVDALPLSDEDKMFVEKILTNSYTLKEQVIQRHESDY